MIKINATTHTQSGLTISTGSILDVKPHFLDPTKIYVDDVFDKVTYPISFDVYIYKNMTAYKAKDGMVLVSSQMEEYNVAFRKDDVDIQALTSVDGLLNILVDHIENGNEIYPGVGVGNTEIVYPTTDVV